MSPSVRADRYELTFWKRSGAPSPSRNKKVPTCHQHHVDIMAAAQEKGMFKWVCYALPVAPSPEALPRYNTIAPPGNTETPGHRGSGTADKALDLCLNCDWPSWLQRLPRKWLHAVAWFSRTVHVVQHYRGYLNSLCYSTVHVHGAPFRKSAIRNKISVYH